MSTRVGNGKYSYEVDDDWAKLPAGWTIPVAAVTVDSRDRVYGFSRSPEHPIIVFDRGGNVLSSWGAGLFAFPHTIRADAQDNLWIVDRDHGQMLYFSPTGSLLKTVGTRSITATDTVTGSITGTQSGIVVNAAAASTLLVSGYPSTTTAGVANTPASGCWGLVITTSRPAAFRTASMRKVRGLRA